MSFDQWLATLKQRFTPDEVYLMRMTLDAARRTQ